MKGSDIIFYYIIEEKNNFKKIFNIINVKENLIILPGAKKVSKKLSKILAGANAVAVSKELENNEDLKNEIYKTNTHILDGRYLFNYLCVDTVEYIFKANNSKIEDAEITILANYLDNILENNIIILAQKCKLLNIITNNVEKFNNIAEYLHEELGIMIRISKNRKKGLLKSGIVINIDFPEELINKCKFNNKAVLVNLNDKIVISSKSFTGVNVNFYGIKVGEENEELKQHFSSEILYESKIYQKGNFDTIRGFIKNDNVKIKGLIGVNGPINIKEFRQNVLTKMEY